MVDHQAFETGYNAILCIAPHFEKFATIGHKHVTVCFSLVVGCRVGRSNATGSPISSDGEEVLVDVAYYLSQSAVSWAFSFVVLAVHDRSVFGVLHPADLLHGTVVS